jgi:hypothetical protein
LPNSTFSAPATALAESSALLRSLNGLSRLCKLAKEAGASEPDGLGDALMLLLEGGCYTLSTFPGTMGPIDAMARAARALIRAHVDEN